MPEPGQLGAHLTPGFMLDTHGVISAAPSSVFGRDGRRLGRQEVGPVSGPQPARGPCPPDPLFLTKLHSPQWKVGNLGGD